MNVPKIAICEDHNIVVEGVRLMLAGLPQFQLCGHASTEDELLPLLQRERENNLRCFYLSKLRGEKFSLIIHKQVHSVC